LVLVAIALITIVYFFVVPRESFDSRLVELRGTWDEYGIEEPLHVEYAKLNSLGETELEDLRANLLKFNKEEQNPAARDLSGVYIHLVDVSIYRQKMLAKQDEISALTDPCVHLSEFDELTAYKEELLASTNAYAESVDSFVSNNPVEAETVSLFKSDDSAELEQKVKEHRELVIKLKGVCK